MVCQSEADTRRVAILVWHQVDLNLVVGDLSKKIGKNDVRVSSKALPVGPVVPRCLGAERFGLPVGQGLAKRAFGLGLCTLAIDGLQPLFKGNCGLPVERADQLCLPVVPDPRTNAADVADSQNGQQIKPFLGFHRLGKIADRAGLGEIAFLRHVRHQKVISHQPLDGFDLGLLQSEPWGHFAGDLCAQNGMILGPSLADIVQKQRHIERLSIHAFFQDAACHGKFFDQLAAFDLGQRGDALDRVLVDRVAVIHVELHHRDDGRELGDEGRKNP